MTAARYPYTYEFYGLRIASHLELTELLPVQAETAARTPPDVTVDFGAVPPELAGDVRIVDDYQVGVDEILLTVPTVARYLARHGAALTIEPAHGVEARELQLFLIGSGLAAILHQRGLLPLHACAIELDGQCIAFLGDSGTGKSTIAALLSQRGYRLITDDVLVMRALANGDMLAEPSLPILKLWPQSLDASGLTAQPDSYESIDYVKHRIAAPERFVCEPLPLSRLYFLRWLVPATAAPELVALNGLSALMALRANVYRPLLIEAMRREQDFMRIGARLMSRARAFEFRRAMDLANADAQIDALLGHVRQTI